MIIIRQCTTLLSDRWWNSENNSSLPQQVMDGAMANEERKDGNEFEMKAYVLHSQDTRHAAAIAYEDIGSVLMQEEENASDSKMVSPPSKLSISSSLNASVIIP